MIDGIANTGTHTFVEKNKKFPIDIHLHVHSHSMRHIYFYRHANHTHMGDSGSQQFITTSLWLPGSRTSRTDRPPDRILVVPQAAGPAGPTDRRTASLWFPRQPDQPDRPTAGPYPCGSPGSRTSRTDRPPDRILVVPQAGGPAGPTDCRTASPWFPRQPDQPDRPTAGPHPYGSQAAGPARPTERRTAPGQPRAAGPGGPTDRRTTPLRVCT
jgi:hypothetical protein